MGTPWAQPASPPSLDHPAKPTPSQDQIQQRPSRVVGTAMPLAHLAWGHPRALTFPLGPSGSRQVAKMCWGAWGLAASCLTSSSPMPRLDPVTRTLRASAAIPKVMRQSRW